MEVDQRFTVAGMLRTNVGQTPDATMLVDRENRFTWSEHFNRACRVAHALRSEGLGPGSRVAFLDRNSSHYFETLFGGALGGIVDVAVNWRLAPEEMAAVVDDSGAEVLVVHSDYRECLSEMTSGLRSVRRVIVIDGDGPSDLPTGFES